MAKKTNLAIILSFILICAVNVIVFYPSFFHVARADQSDYLMETANINSLSGLIQYSYAWSRHSTVHPGDNFLFRPILNTVLSLERWCFGLNFTAWQVTGFLFHLIILAQLLRLLFLICPSPLAVLLTLHFSVLHIGQEMVIWHHINGYMLFLIFILETLHHFLRYITTEQQNNGRLYAMTGYLTLACFTYEFGILCCLIFAGFLFFMKSSQDSQRIKKTWVLFIPIIVYAVISIIDFPISNTTIDSGIRPFGIKTYLYNLSTMIIPALIAGFSPYLFKISMPRNLLQLTPIGWEGMKFNYQNYCVGFYFNIFLIFLVFSSMIFLLWKTILKNKYPASTKAFEKQSNPSNKCIILFVWVAGILFLSHVLLIAFRSSINPFPLYHLWTLHNFYIEELFLCIFIYCLFVLMIPHFQKHQILVNNAVLTIFFLSLILNGTKTFQMNSELKTKFEPWRTYMERLEKFIDAHKKEIDFSYKFLWREDVEKRILTVSLPQASGVATGTRSDLIFRKYALASQPKYYLVYAKSQGIVSFVNENEARDFLLKLQDKNVLLK